MVLQDYSCVADDGMLTGGVLFVYAGGHTNQPGE